MNPDSNTPADLPLPVAINQLISWRGVDSRRTIERILTMGSVSDNDSSEHEQGRAGFQVITLDDDGTRDTHAFPRFRSADELRAALDPEVGVAEIVEELTTGINPNKSQSEKTVAAGIETSLSSSLSLTIRSSSRLQNT